MVQEFKACQPIDEAKGERRARAIYLDAVCIEITERLIARNPSGAIFRNTRGNAWSGNAINLTFRRVRERIARDAMKRVGVKPPRRIKAKELNRYSPRLFAYGLRHGWVTDGIRAGINIDTLANLAGHANTMMISTVYSHVREDVKFMADQAQLIRNKA